MSDDDALSLLSKLEAHITQEKYVYRHHWEKGDVLIWDNLGIMHKRLPAVEGSDPEGERTLHRIQVMGSQDGIPCVG